MELDPETMSQVTQDVKVGGFQAGGGCGSASVGSCTNGMGEARTPLRSSVQFIFSLHVVSPPSPIKAGKIPVVK